VKIFFYIITFIFLHPGTVKAEEKADTVIQPQKECMEIEVITYDPIVYKKFKRDPFYHYSKNQANTPIESLFDKLRRFLQSFGNTRDDFNTIKVIIGAIVFCAILVILFLVNPAVFYFNKKNKLFCPVEDDIYEYNFEERIRETLNSGDYPEAIRWLYLQTLKTLHEKGEISWDANKTVIEYVYEIKGVELRKIFRKLSGVFVYYRYGNGYADEKQFHDFEALRERIVTLV
jgi:hypothetical protein